MSSLNHTSDVEQGSAAWRMHRAGSITGSGFGDILTRPKSGNKESKTRQNYRMQLLTERVTGQPVGEVNAAALSWGKENEDAARIAYEMYKAAHGEVVFVERVGFQQHKTLDWVGTSPDGLVGENGMIEIKCPFNPSVHLMTIINASVSLAQALSLASGEGDGGFRIETVPQGHLPQIQGNLWVLERQWCDFISYDPRVPEHLQLYVARIERDDEYIAKLELAVLGFLEELDNNVGVLLAPIDEFPKPKGAA